ncbi:MAG: transglutaminase domain-containing protein [Tepidisphaeraceae bacterium]|jgi:transglutaminase-like putative cysteine protease
MATSANKVPPLPSLAERVPPVSSPAESRSAPAHSPTALPPAPPRLSPAAAAAAIVAIGALLIVAPQQIGLIVVAGLLIASHMFNRRLPNMPLLVWTLRFVLFVPLILTSGIEYRGLRRAFLELQYTNLFGYLCAVELAIQYWQHCDRVPPRGEVLVLSGLIFATATNTPDRTWIQWLTPLFMLLSLRSMRDFRSRRPASERRDIRWSVPCVRLAAVGCSFAIAIGGIAGFQYFGYLLDHITLGPLISKAPDSNSAGVSTEPFLGSSSDVAGSPLRVMRINGVAGEAHLRGLAFDTYSNNRWSPIYDQIDFVPATRVDLNATAPGKRLVFTRWVDNLGLLYLPLNSAGVVPVTTAQATWDPQTRSTRAGLRSDPEYVYETIVPTSPEYQGPLCPQITTYQRRRCLDVPSDIDRRVVELARRLVEGASDPARKAAIITHFVSSNNAYSLKINPPMGDHISDFILSKRPGHCQYFASSAVMMLRAVGIPARYVAGYYAHEPDGRQSIVVRARDAHAWAEAWIDGTGWITIDATPPAGLPTQAFPPVGFWRKTWEWIVDAAANVADSLGRLTVSNFLTGVAVLVGIIILIQWVRILLKRRRRGPQPDSDAYACPNADLASLAAAFEGLLKRHDIPCAPSLTWTRHMASLPQPPTTIDNLRLFVDKYTQARFRQPNDPVTIDELRQLLARLDTPPVGQTFLSVSEQ